MRARRHILWAALMVQACDCGGGGEGGVGALAVEPRAIDFERVPVGLAGRKSLTLKNVGSGVVRIFKAELDPVFGTDLRLEGVPAALPSGGEAEVTAVWAPRAVGVVEGSFAFAAEPPSTVRVGVTGIAEPLGLTMEPTALDFGSVRLGEARGATVAIENRGSVAVTIRAVTPDLGTSEEFEATLGGARRLEPRRRATVLIRYAPDDEGLDVGRFILAEDTGVPVPAFVRVRGRGIAQHLWVSPALIEFGDRLVGEVATRHVYLGNASSDPVRVSALSISGHDTGELYVGSATAAYTFPMEIGPGAVRRIAVRYAPIDEGPDEGLFTAFAEVSGSIATVVLRGNATFIPEPRVVVFPPSISFGLARTSWRTHRHVAVSNVGLGALSLTSRPRIEPAGAPFALVEQTSPAWTLAPLEVDVLRVELEAATVGTHTADLVIESDDPARAELRVPMTAQVGTQDVPDLYVWPWPVVMGRAPLDRRLVRSVRLFNLGSAALTIDEITLADTAEMRFSIPEAPTLPASVAPGGALIVGVAYEAPTGPYGPHPGVLRVRSNDSDRPTSTVALDASSIAIMGGLDLEAALSWDRPDANLDLHLVRPGGAFFDLPSDCCRCNPNPDWGVRGEPLDDPLLLEDALRGPGPERLVVERLASGSYLAVVHFDGPAGAPSARAELAITLRGTPLSPRSRILAPGERWFVGTLSWDSASGTGGLLPGTVPPEPARVTDCY